MVGLVMVEAVSTSKLSVLQSEWRNREVSWVWCEDDVLVAALVA